MTETNAPSPQRLLRETILMGITRIQPTALAAVYKTPGVYVQEVPSVVAD